MFGAEETASAKALGQEGPENLSNYSVAQVQSPRVSILSQVRLESSRAKHEELKASEDLGRGCKSSGNPLKAFSQGVISILISSLATSQV